MFAVAAAAAALALASTARAAPLSKRYYYYYTYDNGISLGVKVGIAIAAFFVVLGLCLLIVSFPGILAADPTGLLRAPQPFQVELRVRPAARARAGAPAEHDVRLPRRRARSVPDLSCACGRAAWPAWPGSGILQPVWRARHGHPGLGERHALRRSC